MAVSVIDIEVAENAELIEAMLASPTAQEPGDLHARDVLHKGDADLPAPMVANTVSSAGYVYIWDTQTGERSVTNRNMLPAQLQKRREDGSKVFTLRKPATEPVRGILKCMLHPDERKPEYDAMGLPVCLKANLTSTFQVRLHMQHRHKASWETLEELRKDEERREERSFRRAMIEGSRPTLAQ